MKKLLRLNAKIKENWDRLTDDEIASYQTDPDAFFDAVKKKYGMFRDDAEKRITHLKGGHGFFSW